ncbi:natural killer cells antigen CD94-like [Malaclemys terrapin pileata]|uniref:natural killer cells antigen CD94-like n=1 Tax=Malaclemys terrapin pileata TaxID=2991368 RepID=UPI0023A79C1D|nr:natural killer cells antigen CD94-like [Malaclemys terrapin pileata]
MSEQEVTYTELKFHTTSKQQRIQRPKTIKNKVFQASHPSGNFTHKQLVTHPSQETYKKTGGHKFSPCPEDWRQLGNSCYLYSTNWMTWQRSKDYCTSLGSNLLKIDSKEEWDFINLKTHSYHWIGLSHNAVYDSWVWEDGTAPSSDLFTVTQLYPPGGCVLFVQKEAKSYNCEDENPCICEKAVHPGPTMLAEGDT